MQVFELLRSSSEWAAFRFHFLMALPVLFLLKICVCIEHSGGGRGEALNDNVRVAVDCLCRRRRTRRMETDTVAIPLVESVECASAVMATSRIRPATGPARTRRRPVASSATSVLVLEFLFGAPLSKPPEHNNRFSHGCLPSCAFICASCFHVSLTACRAIGTALSLAPACDLESVLVILGPAAWIVPTSTFKPSTVKRALATWTQSGHRGVGMQSWGQTGSGTCSWPRLVLKVDRDLVDGGVIRRCLFAMTCMSHRGDSSSFSKVCPEPPSARCSS